MFELVEPAPGARRFTARRSVRLGDVSPGGRARLDAIVRYLQDVSDDDTRDAGLDDPGWVVRRTVVRVEAFPSYQEPIELTTWCSGLGGRWAERRVSISGETARVEAAVLWVHVDPATFRPLPLTPGFHERYGPSTGGRTVSSRLVLPSVPDGAAAGERWPLRYTDLDALHHVNNAAVWEAVEQELGPRRELRAPLEAIVEHRAEVMLDDDLAMVTLDHDGTEADGRGDFSLWLVRSDSAAPARPTTAIAARVRSAC